MADRPRTFFTREYRWERPIYLVVALGFLLASLAALVYVEEPFAGLAWPDLMTIGLLWAVVWYLSDLRYRLCPEVRGDEASDDPVGGA